MLAIEWVEKTGGSTLGVAGPGEEDRVHEFLKGVEDLLSTTVSDAASRARLRHGITASHRFELRSLAALLSEATVFAGNDSGPRHLAAATGAPTVTLFGPEHPFEWHPYPTERHPYFFIEALSCRRDGRPGMPPWCALATCHEEQHRCMRLIGVEAVLERCLELREPGRKELRVD